jgi:phosphonate degradation associated HDIG domain protein
MERISQLEHALQSATLAERAGSSAPLIAACLLHDLGHLLDPDAERTRSREADDHHEKTGAKRLSALFGQAVTEPVRLHVDAKRWLCATDDAYFGLLSAASVRSLELQGGPFTAAEAAAFRAQPFAEDAVRLRRWDDHAKVVGAATPTLAHFATHLHAACSS